MKPDATEVTSSFLYRLISFLKAANLLYLLRASDSNPARSSVTIEPLKGSSRSNNTQGALPIFPFKKIKLWDILGNKDGYMCSVKLHLFQNRKQAETVLLATLLIKKKENHAVNITVKDYRQLCTCVQAHKQIIERSELHSWVFFRK